MTSIKKLAIVTGSNKGIGFAIVKGLCKDFDGDVYLTARDVERGKSAVKALNDLGLKPLFHQLDITDQLSVDNFSNHIKTNHGGIDLLINNAAIAFKNSAPEPFGVQAEETIRVNYFGTLRVCEALFPLLRQNSRVVNVSSSAGHLLVIPSAELRSKFNSDMLDVPSLTKLMEKFVKDSKAGKQKEEGWGNSAYAVSKVGVSALTFIQQRVFNAESLNRNVSVNAVHPGYVDTDMTSHKGPLTIEEGAKGPLFLALNADLKGKYVWFDCSVVPWDQKLN
ncbi:carbonyl reductase [NADPH] 1-like [Euwallacea fornicatus]|uniref:carbonyl reductase [NADPH] 1-like n=1 Tax=Euwallacea fornicatus TaxID=995702 RepID=UPI00338DA5E9